MATEDGQEVGHAEKVVNMEKGKTVISSGLNKGLHGRSCGLFGSHPFQYLLHLSE